MLRLSGLALGFCAYLCVGAALAAEARDLDTVFDNTIKITSQDGQELIYFNRDGTFSTTGPAGDTFGRWRIDGDKVCTKTKDAAESCGVIEPNRSVGDQWQHELDGETVTIEIVKGR